MSFVLAGIHPVREALRAGRSLNAVLIARGAGGERLQEIIDLCRSRGIPLRFEPRAALDRMVSTGSHQGVVATLAAGGFADFETVVHSARLLVALDGVQDPHNLGAVVRSACGAGASGVLIPERRAAPLTDVVARASAGALAHVPVARVSNLATALENLKRRGFWIYGLDERAADSYADVEFNTPTLFVLGAEGAGLRELVRKRCDVLVRIPLQGPVSSLNVSVAAGIVLFEWKRRTEQAERSGKAGIR